FSRNLHISSSLSKPVFIFFDLQFCKLDTATHDTVIRDLLKRKWGLKPPTLIITVFGTDFEKKRKLKMIFKKGLWKAAESGCWIVTGGFHLGIMKLAGEAVRDYTDAYGGNRMMAFGVASWDCVLKNELLEAALHEFHLGIFLDYKYFNSFEALTKHCACTFPVIKGTAVYQSEEDNEEMDASEVALDNSSAAAGSKVVRTDIEERPLDPNHNIFILVDSGVSDQARGKESGLRARFERCISQWSGAKVSQDSAAGVTVGPGNLHGVITSSTHLQQTRGSSQSATNENVQSTGTLQGEGVISTTSVTKGSSGTGGSSSTSGLHKSAGADQLTGSQGMATTKFQGEKSMVDLTGKPTKASKTVGSEADILVPMCGLVVGGDRFTLRQVYCSMIQNRCPIVVTKGTSGAADAIAFGLDAASKMATEETVDDKEPVPLENRIESIIEEFLSDMHPDCQSYTEEVNMLCEIINDYSNLVSVFDMEEDSDLDGYKGQLNDYMYQALMGDRHDFVKLFLEQGFSLEEFLTVYMLEKLYTDQLKNMSSKVALRDVGKVIKALVGDFYHPLYLSKEFQAKLMPDKRLEGAGKSKFN
ncbi:putative Transient receptor potential cation channel subfamily m member, partial [Paragonimus heterotremus]